jgi:5-formyltetrahydrofolate cyclo-ligase
LLWSRATVRTGTGDLTAQHRRQLRRELRARRAAITAGQRQRAATRVAATLAAGSWLRHGRRIALYISTGSELDTAALLALARQRGCVLYVPRISSYRDCRLQMVRLRDGALHPNRFGIGEPRAGMPIAARLLDLILLPLLGVDGAGNRIGSGAGYYDRLLAWRAGGADRTGPLLVGLAYECQRVDRLPAMAHDVPVDAIVTETGWHYFHRRLSA